MEANAALQRRRGLDTGAAAGNSLSAAAGSAVYDVLDVEVDKPVKKPQQIETFLTSTFAWGDIAPLFFLGTTDSTLHCYVPSTGSHGNQITYLRSHTSYKKMYHACAQFLDSWGVYLTLLDTKMTLYALPLQSNPQIDGNVSSSSVHTRGGGMSSREKMVVMDETKQTTLVAAHEGAKVVCAVSKQNTLKIYDWTVNRTLELRTQHELPLLLASEASASAGALSPSSSFSLSPSALPVQKLIVLGESHVFLLFKKEWCVLNVDSGKLIEVSTRDVDSAATGLDTIACAIAVPSRQFGRYQQHHHHQHLHHTNDVFVAGKHSAVIVSLAADNEDEEEATIIDEKMRSNPHNLSDDRVRVKVERVLEYNVTPKAAYYHHPLLLLDQHDKTTVYNFGSMRSVQSIPTKSISGASSAISIEAKQYQDTTTHVGTSRHYAQTADLPASFVTVSAPFAMQLFTMKPIAQLVKHAKDAGCLEDAVALCKLCPEDCNLNDHDLQTLYAEYAFELFHKGQYRKAMSLFLESSCDVMSVLVKLYPRDLLPRSSSSRPAAHHKTTRPLAAAKSVELKGENLVQSLLALILFLRHKREFVTNSATPSKNNNNNKDKELEVIDTVLLKCLVLVCEKEEYAESGKKELLALVSARNACEIGEAEIFLRSHRQLKALLAFYAARKQHRKALELLEDLERNATAGDKAATASVALGEELQTSEEYMILVKEYLQRLGQNKAELVFEFSRRVIAVRPALGLSIFTKRKVREQKEDIDPSLVLNHLKTCEIQRSSDGQEETEHERGSTPTTTTTLPLIDSRFLAIEYLTQVILEGKMHLLPRLHDEVVYLLLDAINTELQNARHAQQLHGNRLTSRVGSQRGLVGTLRKKLIVFLESDCGAYHPERMLSRTPMEMVDERAALLSKLGRHHEVLQLYAIELKDASLAEAYCNRCYDAKLADSSIYSALLRLYLRPMPSQLAARRSSSSSGSAGSPPRLIWQRSAGSHLHHAGSSGSSLSAFPSSEAVAAAVSILNKYPERIDVPTALELLPVDVPVASLSFFFRRVVERQVERFRNGQVKKQLSKMENFKVREMLSIKRKGSVTVWSSHCCQVCGKKLGTGTFVRLPGGALLHYSCQPAN